MAPTQEEGGTDDLQYGVLDLRRKAMIAEGKPIDHAGSIIVQRADGFDLDKTIFKSVDKKLPRMMAQERLSVEVYWSDRSTTQISESFNKVPAAPRFDAPILEFMQTECNFCMEHADGSFMDHLRFCFEYSMVHFKGHSPRVMFLHSILGVGTNYFPMEKEKIPKLRELLNEVEMKHIEAFPSILRLLYHGQLMDELLADAETLPKTLQSISFHRVIDNEELVLTADEFWVALNYQLMHQLDFLPVANWAEAVDDQFFVFFLGLYEVLTRAGKLEAEVNFDLKMATPPSDLARPSMTLGRFINKIVPGTVKKNIARQTVARFSELINHSLDYKLTLSSP
ncbi:unnamed protein product [Symbiodinium sp. CCMP2456]|nr:unnamed protein product [Symbiodinium sp. CCMP2456]